MRAVVLVVRLAIVALKAGLDLRAHANTITDFAGGDFVPNANCLANDLMSDTDWHRRLSPAATNRVHIGTTDTASIDFDINVAVLEWLCFELQYSYWFEFRLSRLHLTNYLLLLKVTPLVLRIDHKTFELVWVRHLGRRSWIYSGWNEIECSFDICRARGSNWRKSVRVKGSIAGVYLHKLNFVVQGDHYVMSTRSRHCVRITAQDKEPNKTSRPV